jgi:hypothetical protein
MPEPNEDQEDEDDIVPGPLDEEDGGRAEDHSPLSNSVPGEDLPPDADDGDPQGPAKAPILDPLIVDE